MIQKRDDDMVKATLFKNVQLVGYEPGEYHVLVADGRIANISRTEQLVGGAEVVDGSGSWLSPSMIDWHTHQKLNAVSSHRLHLQTCRSFTEVVAKCREALTDPRFDPAKDINLVGVNMRVGSWPDLDEATRQTLDTRVTSERPVYLYLNGYHSVICNTYALRQTGMSEERIQRHDGHLKEQEAFEIRTALSTLTEDTIDEWVMEEGRKAAAMGVTEIVDLEQDHNIRLWQRRYAKGFRSLRVHVGFYEEHVNDAVHAQLRTGDDVPGCGGLVKVGPYKIITDGGLGSQTAFCCDPYPNTSDYGVFAYPQKSVAEMLAYATEHGLRLAVHAIGDHANRICLQTMAALPKPPLPGSTIEHAQLLDFADLPLFKRLGLIASIQPSHLVDDRELCHKFWPGREGRAYAFKSILDAGVPIKMGSDCPVAPMQPWEAIAVAISRKGQGEETAFCGEQVVGLEQAWIGSTSNGKKSLDVGDLADLILLGSNPLACDAAGLRAMQVKATMLGGEWTFRDGKAV